MFVSQLVQIETARVLVNAYGLGKGRPQEVLGAIAGHPAFQLQRRDVFLAALQGSIIAFAAGGSDAPAKPAAGARP